MRIPCGDSPKNITVIGSVVEQTKRNPLRGSAVLFPVA
jgi:hypothetical protein